MPTSVATIVEVAGLSYSSVAGSLLMSGKSLREAAVPSKKYSLNHLLIVLNEGCVSFHLWE